MTSRRARAARRWLPGVPRPERFLSPLLGSALLLAAWAGVAHASGSGWVQAVGALVAGILLLGLLAPALAASRLSVICEASPRDGVAGTPVTVTVRSSRPGRVTPLEVPGAPVLVDPGEAAALVIEPERRGVVHVVRCRVASAAPIGLVWWSRDVTVELPHPLHVAPRTGTPSRALVRTAVSDDGRLRPRPSATGDLRGVRPYDHGDGRRRIHWRASAHTGDLMVRETEQRDDRPVHIAVELAAEPDAAELRAEEAMGTVAAHLAAGDRVVLETHEATGRVQAPVADLMTAGRRLARAVSPPDIGGRR